MKVLINTPDVEKLGGVANHYKGLRPYWTETVEYNFIAGRKSIPGAIIFPFDVLVFFFKLLFSSYDAVVLNPSLGSTALKRDAIFLKVASLFKAKKLVFFHGWSEDVANSISQNPNWFLKSYGVADAFLVLASSFKRDMIKWKVAQPVFLTTTKIDDRLVKIKDIASKTFNNTLLFLARVEENKGIFVTLKAFNILQEQYPHLKLKVAGDGAALESAKDFTQTEGVQNVEFLGNVSGDLLIKAFASSDIYILPTWHGEGLPTSILEAMAFGLPIITRPVGGINDFFKPEKMGALIDSKKPEDFADAIAVLLHDKVRLKAIAEYNHQYAKDNFMASQVALNIESVIKNICK